MSLTLYHYVHCPYCLRVRMALGFLKIPYESKVVPYDDEATPLQLTGKKMLPALVHEQGAMNESLDIIDFIDKKNSLTTRETLKSQDFKKFELFLTKLAAPIHSLAMPYWMYTPEFSESSRMYFQKKKEEKRGSFKDLVKNKDKYFAELLPLLKEAEEAIDPFYHSKTFNIFDILLASHIWGLYIVPEFQFSDKLHQYLQSIKKICHFDYHKDFWE
jgi:glutaredoxin 2